MIRERLKAYALRHEQLLKTYRKSVGKIKTQLYFNAQSRALQKGGISLIESIDQALTDLGAKFFIDCGTLLGLYRDGKPAINDKDIDFGIWFDQYFTPELLEKTMKSLGLKLVSKGLLFGVVQEMTFSKGIVHIDFFRHTETETESRMYIFYRDVQKQYPTNKHYSVLCQRRVHIPELKRVTIAGIETSIPANTEEYLASTYTNNWRIPDPNWSYWNEPGCTKLDHYGIRK